MSAIASTHVGSLAAPLASSDDHLIQLWLSKDKSERTQKLYRKAIKRLRDWLAEQGAADLRMVNAGLLAAYGETFPEWWSDNTLNVEVAAIKSLWAYGCEGGYFAFDIPRMIWALKAPTLVLPERILTRAEVEEAIKAEWDPSARLLIRTLFGTGVRAAEALALRWSDLSEPNGDPLIVVRKGKGGKTRVITCMASAWRELMAVRGPAEAPIFQQPYITAYRQVRDAFERIGKQHVSPHWLRHAAAVEMRRAGMDWPDIARQLGHSKPSTTLNAYSHLTDAAPPVMREL